jgi:uncharacterized membrane protein
MIIKMENKQVGWLIVGIAVVIGIIIFIFNIGLKNIVDETCSHGPTCTMFDTIAVQTWISLAIAGIILVIGLVIMFMKPIERIVVKKIKEKKKKIDLNGLNSQEKDVINLLQDEGAIFQRTLMEKLEIGKVGMTRILDKLESKGIVERKRRGMNNVVVLK